MTNVGTTNVGVFKVETADHRGWTPEELAERALDRIIYVGGNSHPAIREQAEAFRSNIRAVLVHYLKEAVQSERTTLAAKFQEAGHPELVKLLD
jgi:TRAP-type uncharacterized transport system substrate-binding protein